MELPESLNRVRDRIQAACLRVGRAPADVTLVAVTKSVDAATVQALLELGVQDIAENRQQTASEKLPQVPALLGARRPTLHFIGPLQRNKVKRVLEWFHVIHSVDSARLADEIDKRAAEIGRTVDVFIEINVAGESQKQGVNPAQAAEVVGQIAGLPHLRICGLMAMAPYSDNPEAARPHFRALAVLSRRLLAEGVLPAGANGLSMGMSGDFEVAIEEGATHVRIGSALFE